MMLDQVRSGSFDPWILGFRASTILKSAELLAARVDPTIKDDAGEAANAILDGLDFLLVHGTESLRDKTVAMLIVTSLIDARKCIFSARTPYCSMF